MVELGGGKVIVYKFLGKGRLLLKIEKKKFINIHIYFKSH